MLDLKIENIRQVGEYAIESYYAIGRSRRKRVSIRLVKVRPRKKRINKTTIIIEWLIENGYAVAYSFNIDDKRELQVSRNRLPELLEQFREHLPNDVFEYFETQALIMMMKHGGP